jgi:hypothetical protein
MSPVFILGITGRSGTNYLYNLLQIHPDCEGSNLTAEDFIIFGLDKLEKFTTKIGGQWKKEWKYDHKIESQIKKSLGDGISAFLLNGREDKCIVSKTPSTINIAKFFTFFPDAKLIIMLRDGKDVVESGVNSNFWNYEMGFHIWNKSAKRIVEFINENKSYSDRILIIKYENLINSLSKEINKTLSFCNLTPSKYDVHKANKINLLGSSSTNQKNKKFVWEVVTDKSNFSPLIRSQNWSKTLHYRYNKKCGDNAKKLGYLTKHSRKGIIYHFTNLIWDIRFFYVKIKYKLKPI